MGETPPLTLFILCLGVRFANVHNSSISNKFANDGSFLQQFLKLQKAQTSTGEHSPPSPVSSFGGSPSLVLSLGAPSQHLRCGTSDLALLPPILCSLSTLVPHVPTLNAQGGVQIPLSRCLPQWSRDK